MHHPGESDDHEESYSQKIKKKIVGGIDTKPPNKFWFCGFNLFTGLTVIAGYQVL